MTSTQSTKKTTRPLNTAEGFILGGIAACVAVRARPAPRALPYLTPTQVTFSNIPDVAKTRMQLQGELAKDGGVRVYKNVFDVLGKTWKNEGLKGLQRGLGPAVSILYIPRMTRI